MSKHRSRPQRLEQNQAEMRERVVNRKLQPASRQSTLDAFEQAIEDSGITYGEWLNAQAARFGITTEHVENLVRKTWPMPDGTPLHSPVPAIMVRTSWKLAAAFVREVRELQTAVAVFHGVSNHAV